MFFLLFVGDKLYPVTVKKKPGPFFLPFFELRGAIDTILGKHPEDPGPITFLRSALRFVKRVTCPPPAKGRNPRWAATS